MEFVHSVPRIVLTSLLSIAVLFGLCKLIGQRQISQMSMFDYINSITIGSIAAELATDLEKWWEPLTATIVYGLAAIAIDFITCKSLKLRKFFNGKPIVLYQQGKLYKGTLKKAKLDINENLTQCRVAGYFDLSQLEAAVLETNGQLSFMPLATDRPVTPKDLSLSIEPESLTTSLIIDGNILWENLKQSGYNEQWLRQQLHLQGIGQVSDVFFATCDKQGNFSAYRMLEKPVQHELFE